MNAQLDYTVTFSSSLTLENYTDDSRAALAQALRKSVGHVVDMSDVDFTTRRRLATTDEPVQFTLVGEYTAARGENTSKVSDLLKHILVHDIESGGFQQDLRDLGSNATINVTASARAVEESTPSFKLVERDELPLDPADDEQTRTCPAGTFSESGASECSA